MFSVLAAESNDHSGVHACVRALRALQLPSMRTSRHCWGLIQHRTGRCYWAAVVNVRLGICLCRVLFAPNLHDASPRVLAEAMCLDVPILVNRHILGGWKYVNNRTGAFFGGEDDVVEAFKGILAVQEQGQMQPRQWYKCAPAAFVGAPACLELALPGI